MQWPKLIETVGFLFVLGSGPLYVGLSLRRLMRSGRRLFEPSSRWSEPWPVPSLAEELSDASFKLGMLLAAVGQVANELHNNPTPDNMTMTIWLIVGGMMTFVLGHQAGHAQWRLSLRQARAAATQEKTHVERRITDLPRQM